MPRRIPDYAQQFADWNMVSIDRRVRLRPVAARCSCVPIVKCIRGGGAKAPAKPWEGADTLEWTLPSPAPYHTFETPPVVK